MPVERNQVVPKSLSKHGRANIAYTRKEEAPPGKIYPGDCNSRTARAAQGEMGRRQLIRRARARGPPETLQRRIRSLGGQDSMAETVRNHDRATSVVVLPGPAVPRGFFPCPRHHDARYLHLRAFAGSIAARPEAGDQCRAAPLTTGVDSSSISCC